MLKQFFHLDYSDNGLMLGLDYDSITLYGWMFTYECFKFVVLPPQITLYTTSSTHTSLYEVLG